jgi:hypothetical protein
MDYRQSAPVVAWQALLNAQRARLMHQTTRVAIDLAARSGRGDGHRGDSGDVSSEGASPAVDKSGTLRPLKAVA